MLPTLTDLILSSDEYYSVLKEWSERFYKEWLNFEKEPETGRK